MHKKAFFFLIVITLLLLSGTQRMEAARTYEMTKEVVELTCLADFREVQTYVDPSKKKYDIMFKNTGTFPVELCIKFNYINKRDHYKKKHYMHHIVNEGEELSLSGLYFEPCKGNVYVHIRMTSLCKEPGAGMLSSYRAGAEGTLILTEIKK